MQNRPHNGLTYFDIHQSLTKYDRQKSLWHKLISDMPEIASLRRFARDDHHELSCTDLFGVLNILDTLDDSTQYGHAEATLMASFKNNKNVENLIVAMRALKEHNLFTKDNFAAVLTVRYADVNTHSPAYRLATSALKTLNDAGILTPENRDAINQCLGHPIFLANILIYLNEANILTPENRSILITHAHLKDIRHALPWLNRSMATQANFDALIHHEKPEQLSRALSTLASAGILNHQTRDIIKKHTRPEVLAKILLYLHDPSEHYRRHAGNLFTPENIDAVANHVEPFQLIKAFINLDACKILTPENRDLVKNHLQPESLASALIKLNDHPKHSLFSAENSEMIKIHFDPNKFYWALYSLHQANLLTPENREAVKNHTDTNLVAMALKEMCDKRCLNQIFFHRVINTTNPAKEMRTLLTDLPRLKNETSHPYTKGAIQGLFSKVNPTLPHDMTDEIARYLSRASGGNIAKTCQAAANAAREEEGRQQLRNAR